MSNEHVQLTWWLQCSCEWYRYNHTYTQSNLKSYKDLHASRNTFTLNITDNNNNKLTLVFWNSEASNLQTCTDTWWLARLQRSPSSLLCSSCVCVLAMSHGCASAIMHHYHQHNYSLPLAVKPEKCYGKWTNKSCSTWAASVQDQSRVHTALVRHTFVKNGGTNLLVINSQINAASGCCSQVRLSKADAATLSSFVQRMYKRRPAHPVRYQAR